MLSPSPPGTSAAARTAPRRGFRERRPDGPPLPRHRAPPLAPIAEPNSTSESASGPRYGPGSRPPRPRRGPGPRPGAGRTKPTPSAKATAEAEWPDGIDELVGCGWTKRKTGRCSGRGRVRGSRVLNNEVGDRRGHALGDAARAPRPGVSCRAQGHGPRQRRTRVCLCWRRPTGGGRTRHGLRPADGDGAHQFAVEFRQPARSPPQHGSHFTTILPGIPPADGGSGARTQPGAARHLPRAQRLRGSGEQQGHQNRNADRQQGQSWIPVRSPR